MIFLLIMTMLVFAGCV